MALRVSPCNRYAPSSDHQPNLLWDLDLYARLAYAGLVWRCRYGGVEAPDALWCHAGTGAGRPYADDQAGDLPGEKAVALAVFDGWVEAFVAQVAAKGPVPGADGAARSVRPTTL